ncbi:hypothetical protein H4N64_04125 [Streptomyces sp. PSKA01]|uniref:HTH luxR-type domain-containing protein n=1 Tax=Streptomyces cupreus TaxID=2759956 RepID=A0A7X1IZK3_9ACTN|nr:hypothetical protein [Streptomyces cupreus]
MVARLRADHDNLRAALDFGLTARGERLAVPGERDTVPGGCCAVPGGCCAVPGVCSAVSRECPAEPGEHLAVTDVPAAARAEFSAVSEDCPAAPAEFSAVSDEPPAARAEFSAVSDDCPAAPAEFSAVSDEPPAARAEFSAVSDDPPAAPAEPSAVSDDPLATPEDRLAALRLAGTLWFYWHACGAPREGRHWLERALAANPEPTPERARALWIAGLLAAVTRDLVHGRRLAEEARALARDLGDQAEAAHAAYVIGVITLFLDDLPTALTHFEAAATRGRVPGQHLSLVGLDRVELACALGFLGEADRAVAVCEEARRLCERHGEEWVHSYVLRMLALAHTVKRDWPAADRHAHQALRLKLAVHDITGIALTLDLLARIATETGAHEHAALLLGGADRIWSDIDRDRWGSAALNKTREDSERRARAALSEAAYEKAYRHGSELDLTELVGQALDEGRAAPEPAAQPRGTHLTPRESQVAELVAQGLANHQIADRLVIARRTAEGHVERILGKLGLSNRSQLAAWVTARH